MAELSNEDLERLASRMAMLVSEGGEAENAGRAVAALSRRLGLSGGQLKAFFLAGATQGLRRAPQNRASPDATEQIDHLERELSALRHGLKLTEVQARNAQRERDALRSENNMLVDALDRARSAEQVRRLIAGVVIAAVMLVAAVISLGPALRAGRMADGRAPDAGSPFLRSAVVRAGGANLLREPEQGALAITQLPVGARVQVRQTLWRGQMQWAEVEVGGLSGYVLSTEIDIS